MGKKLGACTFIFLSVFSYTQEKERCLAIVTKPVIDALGDCIDSYHLAKKIYEDLPRWGDELQASPLCKRIHQLLCNEIVEVMCKKAGQVCIKVPHAYYMDAHNNYRCCYWTLEEYLTPYQTISAAFHCFLPDPIEQALLKGSTKQTLVLTQPWQPSPSSPSFSAGTRFVYKIDPENKQQFLVYVYNAHAKKVTIHSLSRSKCIVEQKYTQASAQQARTKYLALLQLWSHSPKKIHYVWGGSSYCNPLITNDQIISGFDCSGLILRAAQTAGIPYFCKNSRTAAHVLPHICAQETLLPGDLIYIPGHVLIIASVQPAYIFEARGYCKGEGCVQQMPLSKIFQHITTFDDLRAHLAKKQSLKRLDMHGKPFQIISQYQLYRLSPTINTY